MTDLPFETTVPVRYQDLDALGHVNNAVYATYLEEGRIAFITDELDLATDDVTMVVAHLELDFDAPIVDAETVTVRVGPTDVGEKSFTLTYEIVDSDAVVSHGETVQVWIDRDTGTATTIPHEIRSHLVRMLPNPERTE